MFWVWWLCDECQTENEQEVEGFEAELQNLELGCYNCDHIGRYACIEFSRRKKR